MGEKKNEIPWLKSNSGMLTIYANGTVYHIKPDHQNYNAIVAALKNSDAEEIKKLADIAKNVANYVSGKVKVEHGIITYNGKQIHNGITTRILELQAGGYPFGYMAKFLENIMQNPSYRATQELYDFLKHRNLPITDDGHFLAYKSVTYDWKDHHTGTFDNSIGKLVEEDRNLVDDDRNAACSRGLHAGTIEYVKGFTPGHIVVVKINPADVVSVPTDCNCQKLRTCRYLVLEEYKGDLNEKVYSTAPVAPVSPSVNDEEDYGEGSDGDYNEDEDEALTPEQLQILKSKGFDVENMDEWELLELVEMNPKLLEKTDPNRQS